MSNAASGTARPPHSPRAVVFGEALVDVIDGTAFPGGSPLNVAVGLSRLGVTTRLAGRFGDDAHGALIAEHLRASDVAFPDPIVGATTSRAEVVLNDAGQAQYEFTLDSTLPETSLDGVELVHTGSLGAVLAPGSHTVARAFASAEHALRSYDPNIRPALMVDHADTLREVESLVAMSHIVKLSDEDAEWLYPGRSADGVLEYFLSLGAQLAVLTRGAAGCLARTTADAYSVPAPRIVVADTVGAGDSFMAALLTAVLDGPLAASLRSTPVPDRVDVTNALEFAVRAAGITSSRVGANPPRAHEVVTEREVDG